MVSMTAQDDLKRMAASVQPGSLTFVQTDRMATLAFIGALVNSALYLTAVFAAGLILGRPQAWQGALVAMGATYLSYALAFCTVYQPWVLRAQWAAVILSVVVGVAAGIALI